MRQMYLRGLLASIFGAGIGTTLALAMGVLWPLGALMGGLAGFLAYNSKEVIAAAPEVWRELHGINITIPALPKGFWSFFGWCFLAMALTAHTAISCLMLLAVILNRWMGNDPPVLSRILEVSIAVPVIFAVFPSVIAVSVTHNRQHAQAKQEMKELARKMNLISAIYGAIVGPIWLVLTFIPRLLREVYSDERLVVGMSALAGTLTGYRHASIVAGLVCAAVLWSVQYYAITIPLKRRLAARAPRT